MDEHYGAREVISGNSYGGIALGQLAIFSCYFSPNVPDVLVELDRAALEKHIQKGKGPLILASEFNAKVRAWTRGPRDPRVDLLEEMMAAYNLVVACLGSDTCISGSHKKHSILGGFRRRVAQRSPIYIDENIVYF